MATARCSLRLANQNTIGVFP